MLPNDESKIDLNTDDVLDLLGKDDEEEEGEEEKEEKEEKKEDVKEEKEEEEEEKKEKKEEEEEIDLEKLELSTPPRKKEILKAYPDLFKKFPYLEYAYYNHHQYIEVVPTIEDAKEAVEKAEQLDIFESQLLSGNTEDILRSVKKNDPEAFNKIADNYLITLGKVDEKAYLHVVSNVVKHTIVSMIEEAKDLEEGEERDELLAHARAIKEFIFGKGKVTGPSKLSREEVKDDSVKKEREELNRERYESAQEDLQTKVDNVIMSTIDANLDPKKSMSSFVKKHAGKEAFDKLEEAIIHDRMFKGTLDKLWKSAFEDKFSRASLDKIRSAYLSKARTLLPSIIKNARNEALKGLGKTSNEEEKDHRGPLPVNRTSSTENKRGNLKIPEGMSNKDFLMSD